MTIDRLIARYRSANKKWTLAVFRPSYTDDPPQTPAQVSAMKWAEAWRAVTHLYEDELLKCREIRRGLVDGVSVSVEEPGAFLIGD